MKNSFFVSAIRHINLVYKVNGKVYGNRFELRVVISSDRLNKSGFVIDFIEMEKVLDSLERKLDGVDANNIIGKDNFDFKDFLLFIKNYVADFLKEEHIFISEISLINDREGYIARFNS